MNGGPDTSRDGLVRPDWENVSRQRKMRILLLGGTSEAREIAHSLSRERDVEVSVSLARSERLAHCFDCAVRIGGWGGEAAYRDHLVREGIDAVIDATHPFADEMGRRTARIAHVLGIVALRFMRPPWIPQDQDNWTFLDNPEDAARHIPASATVFLATGRRDMDRFANLDPRRVLRRVREKPETEAPFEHGSYVVLHGPVSVAQEIVTLGELGVNWIITRNSGGQGGWPKLAAARALGIPVAMIRRPPPADLPCIDAVDEALNWVRSRV